jgi:hypothetical protein
MRFNLGLAAIEVRFQRRSDLFGGPWAIIIPRLRRLYIRAVLW